MDRGCRIRCSRSIFGGLSGAARCQPTGVSSNCAGHVPSSRIFPSSVALRTPAQTLERRVTHPPGRLIRPSWMKGMGVPPSLLRLSWNITIRVIHREAPGFRLSREIRCRPDRELPRQDKSRGQIGSTRGMNLRELSCCQKTWKTPSQGWSSASTSLAVRARGSSVGRTRQTPHCGGCGAAIRTRPLARRLVVADRRCRAGRWHWV